MVFREVVGSVLFALAIMLLFVIIVLLQGCQSSTPFPEYTATTFTPVEANSTEPASFQTCEGASCAQPSSLHVQAIKPARKTIKKSVSKTPITAIAKTHSLEKTQS